MATKTTTTTVALGEPSVSRNVRSDLRKSIETYWVREKPATNIGMQYIRRDNEDGLIYSTPSPFERIDLFVVQYSGVCNVFLDPVLDDVGGYRVSIQPYRDVTLTDEERTRIKAEMVKVWANNSVYVQHEVAFLNWIRQNMKSFDGLTPVEVAQRLQEAGY